MKKKGGLKGLREENKGWVRIEEKAEKREDGDHMERGDRIEKRNVERDED